MHCFKINNLIQLLKKFFQKKQSITDYASDRKYISNLLFQVLTEKIPVREALLKFPPDVKDPSCQTCWHALCHREADEDLRRRDIAYAEEQDEYLELIAFTFQRGGELPDNIINSYKKYYIEAPVPHKKGIKGVIENLKRYINI